MDTRLTLLSDYNELLKWWKWFRFPAPTTDMLPNNLKDGIMISLNEVNICAGFIYRTPSSICWVEYIVSNPQVKDKKVRKEAVTLLINTLCELGYKMGFKLIFTSVKNQNLINHYNDCGFIIGPKNTSEMIKVL